MAGMAHAMPAHLYIDAQNPFIPNKLKKQPYFYIVTNPNTFFLYIFA